MAYQDRVGWVKKSISTSAKMGKFSSDRAILDYAQECWVSTVSRYLLIRNSVLTTGTEHRERQAHLNIAFSPYRLSSCISVHVVSETPTHETKRTICSNAMHSRTVYVYCDPNCIDDIPNELCEQRHLFNDRHQHHLPHTIHHHTHEQTAGGKRRANTKT